MESTSPIRSSKKKNFASACLIIQNVYHFLDLEMTFQQKYDLISKMLQFPIYKIYSYRCESKTYVYTHWSVFRYCHRNMIKKTMQMHT